jgi:hypothetical protein
MNHERVVNRRFEATRSFTLRQFAPVLFLGAWLAVALAWPILMGH